jgi:hypothetical protein
MLVAPRMISDFCLACGSVVTIERASRWGAMTVRGSPSPLPEALLEGGVRMRGNNQRPLPGSPDPLFAREAKAFH